MLAFFILSSWEIGEINAIASVDANGDGESEIFLGTSKGLYRMGKGSRPEEVKSVKAPVLHISTHSEGHLLLTLEDLVSPVVVFNVHTWEVEQKEITGDYSKAYAFNGGIYLLSREGMFVLRDGNLSLVLEGARDLTVCGVGGEERLLAVSDVSTLIISPEAVDTLSFGSSFVVCGDERVYTEYGAISFGGGKPHVDFKSSYYPRTVVADVELKIANEVLYINGVAHGESRAVGLAAFNNSLFAVYGRRNLNLFPINRPFIKFSSPYILKSGSSSVYVTALNLMNSTVEGVFPVKEGSYTVIYGGREFTLQISGTDGYDLAGYILSEKPISVSYRGDGVEIYVKLDRPSRVEVEILNFTGKVVRTVYSGFRRGAFKVFWDGRTSDGKVAHRGVYFVRVRINGIFYSERFIWLR